MKHLIIRRKQIRVLLFLLLAMVILLGVDASGIFFKRLKFILERELGKKFQAIVKIDSVEGGILRNLVFKNLEVYRLKNNKRIFILRVKHAHIDYRFWHTILNVITRGKHRYHFRNVYLFSPSIYIEGLLTLKNADLKDEHHEKGIGLDSKRMLGKIAEELTISVRDANIFFWGARPAVQKFSGMFTLGKDWMRGKGIYAQVWGVPLSFNCRFYNVFKNPQFDLQFTSHLLDAFLNVNGTLDDFDVFGMIDLFNRSRGYFFGEASLNKSEFLLKNLSLGDDYLARGRFDLKERFLHFEVERNGRKVINLESHLSSWSQKRTNIRLREINIVNAEISTDIDISTLIYLSEQGTKLNTVGVIAAKNTTINNEPCYNLVVDYKIIKDKFFIKNLSMAKGIYTAQGWIEFIEPYQFDVDFRMNNGPLADFWALGKDESGRQVKGTIKGKMKVWGTPSLPKMKGYFESKDGDLENFKYESGYAMIEAEGPVIKIIDGFLSQVANNLNIKRGDYILDGQIDLRKVGTTGIIKELKLRPVLASNKDDQTADEVQFSQLVLGRDINKRIHVDYKASYDDETRYEDKQEAELELKYKLKRNQILRMRLKEDEEFIGVEHKIKF